MTLPLNVTLSANSPGAYAPMLASLQANILKAHVRDHLSLLLFTFPSAAAGRDFLRRLTDFVNGHVKSAAQHLEELAAFNSPENTPGTPFVGVGLSYAGYLALGITSAPTDPAFRQGMRHDGTRARLLDPAVSTCDPGYQDAVHALVVIADAGREPVERREAAVLDVALATGVRLVGAETGLGYRNENKDGIEHFGYMDGRSQPLSAARPAPAGRPS